MRPARTIAVLAAFAAIVTTAACTSGSSKPASSASSVSSTAATGSADALATALRGGVSHLSSAHFVIAGTVGGQQVTGSGVQRVEGGRLTGLQADTTLPGLGAIAVVVDGADRYVKLPASLAASGKPWAKVSADSTNVIVKQFSGLLDGAFAAADLSALDKLVDAAKSVRKVGTEQVSGAPATRYDLVIDPAKLPAGLAAGAGLGTADIPATIWVDGQGRPVRVRAAVPVAGQPVRLTVTFDRFGQPVAITPPPASQVAAG